MYDFLLCDVLLNFFLVINENLIYYYGFYCFKDVIWLLNI